MSDLGLYIILAVVFGIAFVCVVAIVIFAVCWARRKRLSDIENNNNNKPK